MATKVKSIGFTRLTNAEHLNFHLEAKLFMQTCGTENISATDEFTRYLEVIDVE